MIAMLDFDGTCYGLWENKQEFLESKKESPEMHELVEGVVYREVNTLEELKALMEQAFLFKVFGKGEPI